MAKLNQEYFETLTRCTGYAKSIKEMANVFGPITAEKKQRIAELAEQIEHQLGKLPVMVEK